MSFRRRIQVFWFVFLTIILVGCATPQKSLERTAIPKPSKMLDYELSQLDENQVYWMDQINRFYQADMETVVIPHARIVNQLNDWPQDQICSADHLALVNKAIELNSTSLLALTFRSHCAQLFENEQQVEETHTTLAALSDLLLRTGNGLSPEQAVEVRDIYEVNIIFQWAGLNVFDIELLRLRDQVVYKLHTFDAGNDQYGVYYANNSQYVAKNLRQSGQTINDAKMLADLILQGNLDTHDTPAMQWQFAAWMRDNQPQKVIEYLSQEDELRLLSKVLLTQAYFHLDDQQSVNIHIDDILSYSEVGFVDASAVFGQVLLNSADPMEISGAANLYRINSEQLGPFEATLTWLESFLRLPEEHWKFSLLTQQLDEAELANWRIAIKNYDSIFTEVTPIVYHKLTELLRQLGERHVRAKLDYASLLLDGSWNNSQDIPTGIALISQLAELGEASAQLDLGILYSQGRYGLEKSTDKAFQWYMRSAVQGNPSALYNMGLAYRFGRGVSADMDAAVDYFQQSYDAGFDLAGCRIGDIYSEEPELLDYHLASAAYQAVLDDPESAVLAKANCGYSLGFIELRHYGNVNNAIELLQQAGARGEHNAFFELGLIYNDSDGIEKDTAKAIDYYQRAVAMGNYRAAANLGYMYEIGEGVDVDLQKAISYYTFSARGGSPTGQNNLATFYRYGQVVNVDTQAAFELYQKSYANGNRFAAENLGDMYYFGELGERDFSTACDYYEEAVKRGASRVLFDVAYCYVYGEGREQDVSKGLSLLEKSAQQEGADALVELGRLYAKGELVDKDLQKSLNYFLTAYQFNNPRAAYALGLRYEMGDGVVKDPIKSMQYYQQSAVWGMVEGMLATAKAYLNGYGTVKDQVQAREWLLKAIQKGSEEAKILLKNL
jgi:TPR repeat protein